MNIKFSYTYIILDTVLLLSKNRRIMSTIINSKRNYDETNNIFFLLTITVATHDFNIDNNKSCSDNKLMHL